MKIMVIGSGGREHAIVKSVIKNNKVKHVYCAPGNAGTFAMKRDNSSLDEAPITSNVPIKPMEFEAIVTFAKKENIDLVIVGMDDPLVGGLVDVLEEENIKVFGPNKAAARLEGSKTWAKHFMKKYNIPTAEYEVFFDVDLAYSYLEFCSYPIVIKADGLALGKGVLICNTKEEARSAVKSILQDRVFGDSGNSIVVEEFLEGPEVSVLAFVDGQTIKPMTSAMDYKRAGDDNTGLNTGGMGAISPNPYYTKQLKKVCLEQIFLPTVQGMINEGAPFKGVLYFGLMLTKNGPKIIEYNVRFGDPEAQVVLPRLNTDLVDIMLACIDGTLDQVHLDFAQNKAVGVVLASGGYPVSYQTGYEIQNLDDIHQFDQVELYQAGTALEVKDKENEQKNEGKIINTLDTETKESLDKTEIKKNKMTNFITKTAGGRVLVVTGLAETYETARVEAYKAAELIHFQDKFYRKDIGRL